MDAGEPADTYTVIVSGSVITMGMFKGRMRAYVPAAGFLLATMVAASGVSLMPAASAAVQNAKVTSSVAESVTVSQSCSATSLGAMVAGTGVLTGTDCTITMGTNRPTGYYLGVQEDNVSVAGARPADAYPALCRVAAADGACADRVDATTADNNGSIGNVTANTAITADKFGLILAAKSAGMTAVWTLDGSPALTDAVFQPVGEAGTSNKACDLTAPANAETCGFRFGAQTMGAAQTAGTYEARIAFIGVAD